MQLRQDNAAGTLYNMVGFQTHLKWGEQKRVFSLIPGLEQAEFVRYGVMHRNTFINSPRLLKPTYQLKQRDTLFFAGQMTGVEGYVESAASGLIAGINAARLARGLEPSLRRVRRRSAAWRIISHLPIAGHFQPMNTNFGLLPPLPKRVRDKKRRNELLAERALQAVKVLPAICCPLPCNG